MNEQEAIDRVAHMLRTRDQEALFVAGMMCSGVAEIKPLCIDYRAQAKKMLTSMLMNAAVEACREKIFPSNRNTNK